MPNGIFAALDIPYKPKYRIRESLEPKDHKFNLRGDKAKGSGNLTQPLKDVLKALYDEGISSVPSLLLRVDMSQSELESALIQLVKDGYVEETKLGGKRDAIIYKIKY